ncbi:MAG TPA: acyl-CoA dehydrogenase [Jatrophihabitantaceae bacterium]|nr:acyl-CoA dehydrogenase [Jatrophihabitantaceae bacterium]
MRFAISPEQREFAGSLRRQLAAADTPSVIRAWSAGDFAPGRKLWAQLADAGVTALAAPEEHGGFGAHPVDLVLAFVELGRAAAPGPYVEAVAVLPTLLAGTPLAQRIDAIASGAQMATLAVPPSVPYAVDAMVADTAYLLDGTDLYEARIETELGSVDRARRLAEVAAGTRLGPAGDVAMAWDLGALATAAQLLGAGHAALDAATGYAKSRVQFGKPIGSFQAVKHQLADALVGLELARPLLYGAALAVAGETPARARDVSAAKVACADAAYRASRAALQVHGAIGYTSECDLALWLTKIRALRSAWGTQAEHRARVLAAL